MAVLAGVAWLSVAAGWPKVGMRRPRAMSITSPITALAVGPSPAPGPRITICSTLSPSSTHMFVPPSSWPSGLFSGTRQGDMRCSSPRPVGCATPNSLMR